MLYGWAPGVGSFELPKEAGLPANNGTTHYVVQVHYNNISALAGETVEGRSERHGGHVVEHDRSLRGVARGGRRSVAGVTSYPCSSSTSAALRSA